MWVPAFLSGSSTLELAATRDHWLLFGALASWNAHSLTSKSAEAISIEPEGSISIGWAQESHYL